MSGPVSESLGPDPATRAHFAAFDAEQLPALRSRRDPWAFVEAGTDGIDAQLIAWLSTRWAAGLRDPVEAVLALTALRGAGAEPLDAVPRLAALDGTHRTHWVALAWARDDAALLPPGTPPQLFPSGALTIAAHQRLNHDATRAALKHEVANAEAGIEDSMAAVHTALVGGLLLGDDRVFARAREVAERLLVAFETRKTAFGLLGHSGHVVDLEHLPLLRGAWCALAETVGDHRFLNAALKLAEWTRSTVVPAGREAAGTEAWHGIRARIGSDRPAPASVAATALHLVRAFHEERCALSLEGVG